MGGWVNITGQLTLRVLLVEDDPSDAFLVSSLLREDLSQPCDVVQAHSLNEAVELSAARHFDVVLTDLGLPDSMGLDTADAILDAFPDTPVVVVTGLDDRTIGSAAVQRGCQDYLLKGFGDPQLLLRTLRHAIERHAAARSLRESEGRFRALVDTSPNAILVVSERGLIYVNPAAVAMFGAGMAEHLLASKPEDLLGALTIRIFPRWPRTDIVVETRFETVMTRLDGSTFEAEILATSIPLTGRSAAHIMVSDISARKREEAEYLLAAAVFETTDEAIMVTDATTRIVAVNPSFQRVTGYTDEDVIGLTPHCLSSGRHGRAFYDALWQNLMQQGHWRGEIWNRRKSGAIYVERATISVVRDSMGRVANYVAVFSDITNAKEEVERIRHRANYDALTNLPNRTLMYDRLQLGLAKTVRERGRLGVLFLDLDGFKQVNDTYGHLLGDLLLVEVAQRLKKCVRESDTVARLGGDEFVILLSDMVTPADAQLIASKMLAALDMPFELGERIVNIGASIGIAVYPDHGNTPEQLLGSADQAMYAAKQMGKGRFMIIDAVKDAEPPVSAT